MNAAVETNGRCTGACCTDITLRHDGGQGPVMSWDEVAHRQQVGARQMAEENHLERFLLPTSEPNHFACRMYDATTHKCTIYAHRPETCRTFPKDTIQHGVASNTCRYCGFVAG